MTDDQKGCIESGDKGLVAGCGDSFEECIRDLQDQSKPSKQVPKEELYIGCKVIKAIPMTSDEFKKFKGQEVGNDENADGYKVEYEDGYVSWSPRWTFENAYRKLSNGEKKLLSV